MPKKSDIAPQMPDGFNQIPRSNPLQDDFGWTVPVESIPLPSAGKIYPQGSSLHNRTSVQIKAMTAHEEDILMSRALIKDGSTITHLLNSCILDKSINTRDLIAGDRNAILVAIRITGYGPEYRAEATCTACSKTQPASFDLSELEIKPLRVDPVTPGSNQFEYVLPVSKKRVIFKFLTGKDQEEHTIMLERRKRAMPDMQVENLVTSRLEISILSIDGVTDRNKLNAFISSMPAGDSRALRNYMNENEPGIDMNGRLHCVYCGAESSVSLSLGPTFFWP